MLRCCAVVEELLIIRHQVVRNSRRFMYMCFVICILRLIFMAIKKKNLKLESLALMLRCCATVEILPIIHHQVARYSRHYGSGTLNMYPSVQCTTNYILLKCINKNILGFNATVLRRGRRIAYHTSPVCAQLTLVR